MFLSGSHLDSNSLLRQKTSLVEHPRVPTYRNLSELAKGAGLVFGSTSTSPVLQADCPAGGFRTQINPY